MSEKNEQVAIDDTDVAFGKADKLLSESLNFDDKSMIRFQVANLILWGINYGRQAANAAAAKIWDTRASPEHRDPNRFEIVSELGAAIEVTRINLTDDERESLSINKRLSDLGHRGEVCRCGHDKDRHHDDVDTWCGYWNISCDCRGYQNK